MWPLCFVFSCYNFFWISHVRVACYPIIFLDLITLMSWEGFLLYILYIILPIILLRSTLWFLCNVILFSMLISTVKIMGFISIWQEILFTWTIRETEERMCSLLYKRTDTFALIYGLKNWLLTSYFCTLEHRKYITDSNENRYGEPKLNFFRKHFDLWPVLFALSDTLLYMPNIFFMYLHLVFWHRLYFNKPRQSWVWFSFVNGPCQQNQEYNKREKIWL
jgi:hypothetical protein